PLPGQDPERCAWPTGPTRSTARRSPSSSCGATIDGRRAMSVLTLVRHAQASFPAAEYDRLSEVGQTQASLLGEYWAGRRLLFDEVYTGPRTRQRHTAELAGACCVRTGMTWP